MKDEELKLIQAFAEKIGPKIEVAIEEYYQDATLRNINFISVMNWVLHDAFAKATVKMLQDESLSDDDAQDIMKNRAIEIERFRKLLTWLDGKE